MSLTAGVMPPQGHPRPRAYIGLAILTAIYAMAFVDRQIFSLLIQPIGATLHASDTSLSLLQGLAFTVSYVLFGPIFGWLADRMGRRWLIFMGIVGWTGFSICCGFARSYDELLLARLGLGAMEACLTPCVWPMLADMFDERELPRAFSIFLMGPYIGGGLAIVFGGLILDGARRIDPTGAALVMQVEPWRLAFVLISAPGLLLAAALPLVAEPQRARQEGTKAVPIRAAARLLWERRSFYLSLFVGMAGLDAVLYGLPAWAPTFFMRHFNAAVGAVSAGYGWSVLIAGSLGVLAGPVIARRLGRRRGSGDELLLIPAAMAVGLAVLAPMLVASSGLGGALAVTSAMTVCYTLPQALAAAALSVATPPNMRGIVTATYVLVVTVVGYGVAPTTIALINDRLVAPPHDLAIALAAFCCAAGMLAAITLPMAARAYRGIMLATLPLRSVSATRSIIGD